MKTRRVVSIVLAGGSLLCAVLFLVSMLTYKIFMFNFEIIFRVYPYLTMAMMIPISAVLGIILIVCSGKKGNPVQIAIWGSFVIFLAIPNIIFAYGFSGANPTSIASSFGPLTTAVFIALAVGVTSCIFAGVIQKRALKNAPSANMTLHNSAS